MKIHSISMAMMALTIIACTVDEGLREDRDGTQMVGSPAKVRINVRPPDYFHETRSEYVIENDDSRIFNYKVAIFETAHPDRLPMVYWVGGADCRDSTITLSAGSEYYAIACANYNNAFPIGSYPLVDVNHKASIFKLPYFFFGIISPYYNGEYDGIPMVSTYGCTFTAEDGICVDLPLERLLAKLELSVDRYHMVEYSWKVYSVRLHNVAGTCLAYMREGDVPHPQEDQYIIPDGDYATEADIDRLNRGDKITLYVPENMQGTLLPGNNDPDLKNPESIPDKADDCTYIELKAHHGFLGDVTYRCYLGRDDCSNFDIERNGLYRLVLYPTDEGMDYYCWKMEY